MDGDEFRRAWDRRQSLDTERAVLLREEELALERVVDDILPRLRQCAREMRSDSGDGARGMPIRNQEKVTRFWLVLQGPGFAFVERTAALNAENVELTTRRFIDAFGGDSANCLRASLAKLESEFARMKSRPPQRNSPPRRTASTQPAAVITRPPLTAKPNHDRLPLVTCSRCHAYLHPKNMDRHLQKVHRILVLVTTSRTTTVASSSTKARASPEVRKDDGGPGDADDKSHPDGMRHMGHVVREEGRYGSFPSYDSMDEESEP